MQMVFMDDIRENTLRDGEEFDEIMRSLMKIYGG